MKARPCRLQQLMMTALCVLLDCLWCSVLPYCQKGLAGYPLNGCTLGVGHDLVFVELQVLYSFVF